MAEDVKVNHKYFHHSDDSPLVIFLTGWNLNGKIKTWQYYPVIWILRLAGFNTLVFDYSSNILKPHPDPQDHSDRFLSAYDKVDKISAGYIKSAGEVMIFATSIGSTLGMKLASRYPQKITKIIFNLFISDWVDGLWSWTSRMYRHLTGDLKQHVLNRDNYVKNGNTKDDVREIWDVMNMSQYVKLLNPEKTKFLLYSSKADKLAPFSESKELVDSLETGGFEYTHSIRIYFGHLTSGVLNMLNFRKWLGFLKKN